MFVNDKREKIRKGRLFSELDIGAVYEDKDGVVCIKTSMLDTSEQCNCIAYVGDEWREDEQCLDDTVYPIVCELILKRDC